MAYYTVTGIVKRGIPVLLIAAIIGTMAGQILQARQEMLVDFSVLLILIPPLIKIGGDTGSILGARLSSAFHLGLVDSIGGVVVRNSVLACLLIGYAACLMLSVVVWMAAIALNIEVVYGALLKITLVAGFIDIAIVFAATICIAFLAHRYGLDPDDVVIPITTSIGDIVGIMSVFVAIRVVG
ncbi:MAG TPA: divalent cation transporter [Methanosarcinales archaeon]|nr:divalent cation transporter [Methanosarcinales archaeon]